MQEIGKPQQLEPIEPVRWALYAFLAAITPRRADPVDPMVVWRWRAD